MIASWNAFVADVALVLDDASSSRLIDVIGWAVATSGASCAWNDQVRTSGVNEHVEVLRRRSDGDVGVVSGLRSDHSTSHVDVRACPLAIVLAEILRLDGIHLISSSRLSVELDRHRGGMPLVDQQHQGEDHHDARHRHDASALLSG